jgi:Tfp pilus assembly protein PilO
MKDFIKQRKEIFLLVTFAIVFIGLVYGAIIPLLRKIDDTRNKTQEELLNQEAKRSRLSELPSIKKQFDLLQESNDNVMGILVDRNKAVELIERLEKTAQETKNEITISIADKQPQQTTKSSQSSSKNNDANSLLGALPSSEFLRMTLNLNGTYSSVVDFVSKLENMDYYSDIVSFSIKQIEEKKENLPQSNSGAINPFGVAPKTDSVVVNSSKNGKVEASLDVVFYTAK